MEEQKNTEIATGYKMTELGPLPQEWEVVRLGEVATVKGGKRLPKGQKFADDRTEFPYIRVVDFQNYTVNKENLKFLTPEQHKILRNYIIAKEDIFISIAGTIGLVGKIPADLHQAHLTENAARIILVSQDRIHQDYLIFELSSEQGRKHIHSRATKTSQPKLALIRIKEIPIPLPPLSEQRKIAAILSTVQKAIETENKLIERTKELKKAMMHKLFTEGTRGEKQKMTEIGPVPESWEVGRLGEVAEHVKVNYQPNLKGFKNYVGLEHIESGFPFLNKYGKEFEVKSMKYFFKKGQVLYGKLRPYLDKAVITSFDGICSTDIIVLEGKIVSNLFLVYLLHSELFLKHAISTTSGVQHPRTSWAVLKKLKFAIPQKDEQQAIADILSTIDQKIEFHSTKKQKLEELFRTLLHELMTARVRVDKVDLGFLKKQ